MSEFICKSFPIICAYASFHITMLPWKATTGRSTSRNVEKPEFPYAPEVQPQGEVSTLEFREIIRMISHVVTIKVG